MKPFPISKIHEYAKNPRKHSPQQIERLGTSIKEFGFNQPIVIDETNTILVGHGRYRAAKKLELKEVPVVQLLGLDEAKKSAYRILDNKLQNDSEWDFDLLQQEFDELKDFDFEYWGLDQLIDKEEPEVSEDNFEPRDDVETFIKLGDILELGKHRVMCGDSTSSEDVQELTKGRQFPLCLTDPPYCVEYEKQEREPGRETRKQKGDDYKDPINVAEFIPNWINNVNATVLAFTDAFNKHFHILADATRNYEMLYELVWVKHHFAFVIGRRFQPKHESILIFRRIKGDCGHWNVPSDMSTVLEYDKPAKNPDHPTPKPLEMWGKLIKCMSNPGDFLYEPFSGSGTTLIAAEQLGRICYGMEISPKYCQVILERYQKYCKDNNKKFECKINGEPYSG